MCPDGTEWLAIKLSNFTFKGAHAPNDFPPPTPPQPARMLARGYLYLFTYHRGASRAVVLSF